MKILIPKLISPVGHQLDFRSPAGFWQTPIGEFSIWAETGEKISNLKKIKYYNLEQKITFLFMFWVLELLTLLKSKKNQKLWFCKNGSPIGEISNWRIPQSISIDKIHQLENIEVGEHRSWRNHQLEISTVLQLLG